MLESASWLSSPIPSRRPFLFYLGHLEAFDWNLLGKRVKGEGALNESLDSLFSFGIDPPTGAPEAQTKFNWPPLEEVLDYVRQSRAAVDRLLDAVPQEATEMAIEHRLMHVETLLYMLHQAPYDSRKVLDAQPLRAEGPPGEAVWVDIPGGEAVLGRMPDGSFGWDNEFNELRQHEEPFAVSKHKITNGQYLAFVREGGEVPLFWGTRDGHYTYRGFYAEHDLPEGLPVYVTQRQAAAYAEWCGGSLPTEAHYARYAGDAEFARARRGAPSSHKDPVCVTYTQEDRSPCGVAQAVGNGWEWTRSTFQGLPGFKAHPWYPDYSAAFFTGSHFVVKGASGVTSPRLIRPTFRNWFRDDYPYAYTTFRVVA